MKLHPFVPLFAAAMAFAGCDSVPDSLPDTLREGLGVEVPPHVHVFFADEKATFAAARAALDDIDFSFRHGGPAERELDAISRIASGDAPSSARQFTLKAKFDTSADGNGTEVSVKMTEIIEEDTGHNLSTATEAPLTDTPLYEVFFTAIQRRLAAPSPGSR